MENGHYKMKDNKVVMQAEGGTFVNSGNAANDTWKLTQQFANSKGDGALLWTGKDHFAASNGGTAKTAPIEYNFEVTSPGTYYISLRATRPDTGEPSDRNNDFFVQFEDQGFKKVFFGGQRDKFNWGTTYDVDHQKSPSTFTVTQSMIDENDGIFTLTISARSHMAALDEIHIQKDSFSRDHDAPTSQLVGGDGAPANVGQVLAPPQDNETPGAQGDASGDQSNTGKSIFGGAGQDTLTGGGKADVLDGRDGHDILHGRDGNDTIMGGANNDKLYGDDNADSLMGGTGADYVNGGNGGDRIFGNTGWDQLFGMSGADYLSGHTGADYLSGGTGADTLLGGSGNDEVYGNTGNDDLRGGIGADYVSGGAGSDLVYGNTGLDTLIGGSGLDTLSGGAGSDLIDGGVGSDIMRGGGQRDTFVFREGYNRDVIKDFEDNIDTIRFRDDLWNGDLSASQVVSTFASVRGGNVVFDFGSDELTLEGFTNLGALADDIAIA